MAMSFPLNDMWLVNGLDMLYVVPCQCVLLFVYLRRVPKLLMHHLLPLIDRIKIIGDAEEMLHAFQLVISISVIVDIDECAIGDKGGCHKDARCVNVVGSFRCECKPGYEGNGKTCKGRVSLRQLNAFQGWYDDDRLDLTLLNAPLELILHCYGRQELCLVSFIDR